MPEGDPLNLFLKSEDDFSSAHGPSAGLSYIF